MKRLLGVVLSALSLAGCATLSAPECHNADWRMIGMEDGAQGLSAVQIGKHRSACAKFGVVPDMEAYSEGHDQGARHFCSEARAMEMGRNGQPYNGVCPADVEPVFLAAYDQGREFRARLEEAAQLSRRIHSVQGEINDLNSQLRHKKARLVSSESSELERKNLLEETEDISARIHQLEKQLRSLKNEQRQQERVDY